MYSQESTEDLSESDFMSLLSAKINNVRVEDASTILSIASMVAENKSIEPDEIVQTIISECADGLGMLYMLDAILKKVSGYRYQISKKIPTIFKVVFEHSDQLTRMKMFELRKTWTGVLSDHTLYLIDKKTYFIDENWPLYVSA